MPKMKSHKASKRRLRITPTGKILKRELVLQVQRGQLQPQPFQDKIAARMT